MIKADDKVEYAGVDKKDQPKFTNFEELKIRVEILQGIVDEQAKILRQNNITRTKEISAPSFDEDEVYQRLEFSEILEKEISAKMKKKSKDF